MEKTYIAFCTRVKLLYTSTVVITDLALLMQAWCFAENTGLFSVRFLNQIPVHHCKQGADNSALKVLLWSARRDVLCVLMTRC